MTDTLALDLDGTLLDARPRQVAVAVWATAPRVLDERGFWAAKRAGATTLDALLSLGWQREEAGAAARRWAEAIEAERWQRLDEPLPGAIDALSRARRAGLRLEVVTARRDRRAAAATVKRTGIAAGVDAVHVVSPATAAGEKARLLEAMRPIALVGDTESDAEAARRASVAFVAVSCGQRDAAYLRRHGAEVVLGDVRSAIDHLLETPG